MDDARLAALVGRARRKDPAAFDELIDVFSQRLHGYLYRLTGSRDDADDLLQDLFLRVVRMIDSYEHDGRFEGWLFRIATNLARDRLRRVRRTPQSVPLEVKAADASARPISWSAAGDLSAEAPDAPMMLAEDVDAMQQALAELPAAEREVVMLRHFSDLSFAEIAQAMGTPLGTALARGHRGIAKLRERLEKS